MDESSTTKAVLYKKIKVGRQSGYPIIVTQGKIDHEAILLDCEDYDDDPQTYLTTVIDSDVDCGDVKIKWKVAGYTDYVPATSVRLQLHEDVGSSTKQTTTKKKKMNPTTTANKSKQKYAVGTTVSKVFFDPEELEHRPFAGTVIRYDRKEKLYLVRYEDGDKEELDEEEISTIIDEGGSGKVQSKKKRKVSSGDNPKVAANCEKNKKPRREPSPTKQTFKVGTTVSKKFFDAELGYERPFSGEVISYDSKKTLYWVRYEDGDQEEISEVELGKIVAVSKKPHRSTNTTPKDTFDDDDESEVQVVMSRSGRKTKKVSYAYDAYSSDEFNDEEESEEEIVAPKKRKNKKTNSKKGNPNGKGSKKKKKSISNGGDDSDDFMPSEEGEDDDSELEVEESEVDDDEHAPKRGAKKTAAKNGKKEQPVKKKMCDSFKVSLRTWFLFIINLLYKHSHLLLSLSISQPIIQSFGIRKCLPKRSKRSSLSLTLVDWKPQMIS